ncbi:MAG: diphosphomevalonate decarboxylase [Gammaproteobacteria bacterium]|nr:diphosphomevalonate decarboxylase [Gammaproteobacteria bacterium]
MKWSIEAPANIALIKYMGKAPGNTNIPLNASLSYTLPDLVTRVEIEKNNVQEDHWEPLHQQETFIPHVFSEKAQTRFLNHLKFIKKQFECTEYFTVRSANNFPHGTGLASSASSFAALTKAAVAACAACTNTSLPNLETQAQLSRIGSGSSCRSFFEPWAIWDHEHVQTISLPYPKLIHQVILIHQAEKEVSSSEAHRRVSRLADYPARKIRAEKNLNALLDAFQTQAWDTAYQICWREFQDMHALFSASEPAFHYFTEKTYFILEQLQQSWEKTGDGPLITMDAGPNIHLLYRPDQIEIAQTFKQQALETALHVL